MTVKYTCVVDQKRWFELALSWPKDLKKRYGKKKEKEKKCPETRKSPEGREEAKGLGSCGRKERGKWRESERVGASTTGGEPSLLITDKDTHGLLQRTDHGNRRLIRPVATLQEYPIGQWSYVPYFYG